MPVIGVETTDSGVAESKLHSWFAAVTANIGWASTGGAATASAADTTSPTRTERTPRDAALDLIPPPILEADESRATVPHSSEGWKSLVWRGGEGGIRTHEAV